MIGCTVFVAHWLAYKRKSGGEWKATVSDFLKYRYPFLKIFEMGKNYGKM